MIFNKVFVLVTFALLSLLQKVQGKIALNGRQLPENTVFHDLAPPELLHNSIWERHLERHSASVFDSGKLLRHFSNFKDFHKELKPIENNFKTKELSSKEQQNSDKNPNVNTVTHKTINSQSVYCRQLMKSELNPQGAISHSVLHICNPLPSVTPAYTTIRTARVGPTTDSLAYAQKEKRYGRLISSTAAGINCRRIMNSELNERGEIVDSVTEVCDPPTTTTTTTRKPRLTTTAKTTTTTPKPLIKVCRPVMNSYLSEEGEIIDSVTMVCKMETMA